MALALLQNATAIAPNTTLPFLATGGTAPYTYSVLSGGAGGSINSSGIYTAPSSTGVDTVSVRDSVNAVVNATVTVGNAIELFCDIIRTSMSLSVNQVYLWDQKFNIPTDYKLYIAVGVQSVKPFGFSNLFDGVSNNNQFINVYNLLSVDIMSRGPDARDRKEEVILALTSTYAQQQQEANSFSIAPLSTSFINLSVVDGAAIPYRFNISVGIQYFFSKTTSVGYYNTFLTPTVATNS